MRAVVLPDGPPPHRIEMLRTGWTPGSGRLLSDHALADLALGRPDIVGMEFFEDDTLVGYTHAAPPRRLPGTELETTARREGLRSQLVGAAVRQARDLDLPRPLRVWTSSAAEGDVLSREGLRPGRVLNRVRRRLPLEAVGEPPQSLQLSPFADSDMDAWLEANNRAFADHPDNGAWTRLDVEQRMAESWFDRRGWLTLWDGPRLAGSNWTKVHPEGGEIYVIFIDPDYQGRGLGKAITRAGLAYLHEERGCRAAFLYVEATNSRAMHMYRNLGFTIEESAVVYELD